MAYDVELCFFHIHCKIEHSLLQILEGSASENLDRSIGRFLTIQGVPLTHGHV